MNQKTAGDCGSCTLCCYLLPVTDLKKPAGVLCEHCDLAKGCLIYASRPEACRKFRCAYHQMVKVSKDLRPDNCKIIFEKINEHLFFGTQDPRFSLTLYAKKQIDQFNLQGYSVIISTAGKKDIYLAPHHTGDKIKQEYYQVLKKKYGRSDIRH